ncbi:MAG: hypothetical protein C4K48_08695 [Candidatus Thorarchaeota archaeon]|nr:MAG: hypothetical protein C4K48_08695 [Candidatus Thorarchaeota archaeon]
MPIGLSRGTGLAVSIIAIVAVASLTVVFFLQPQTPIDTELVLTINVGDSSDNYTMSDLYSLPSITCSAGFVKTGTSPYTIVNPSNWTGIPLAQLLSRTGSLPENYSLRILSSDGYDTYFTVSECEGSLEAYNSSTAEPIGIQNFTMVLAYRQNGESISNETGGPLRLIMRPDGDYMSAGHTFAKYIREISVVDRTQPWSLELKGVLEWNMTHDVYYSLGSCTHHRKSITLNGTLYAGVALWTIVSSMDGGNDIHYSFNNSLVPTNYTITVWSETGSYLNFTSYEIAFNNDIVIAGWADEILLLPPEWPLKLVTASGASLDSVIRIEMTGWQS